MAAAPQFKVASAADADRAIATITMAFSSDPVVRWVFPDAHQFLTYWPRFVWAFAGKAFESGTADSVEDCGGMAMWLPPSVGLDDEGVNEITTEAVQAAA